MALPSEYKQVEYIQSSGTQRIDTGYTPKTNTEFEIEYEITQYIAQYGTPFGTRYAHNDRGYYIGFENDNTSFYDFGTNKVDPSTVAFHGVGVRRNITYHNNVLSNGTQSVTVATNQNAYGTLRIFCEEQNGSLQEYCAIKLYKFKLREGSTLIRDFVPVIRKSDNKPGLYDLVNNVFYTNAGTGEFKYPAQSGKITHIYLGTNLIRPNETPSTYEYSYDFRNKSWSTVQSDGWTLAQGTSWTTINSNGINCPTRGQGDSNKFWINRSIDNIGSAKKVTVTMQVYVYASSWGNLAYYKLAAANTPISIAPSMQIAYSGTTASGYQGHTGQLGLPNNETITSPTTIYTGTFLCEGEVDLVNKTSKLTVNGTVVKTGTVSDSTVSAIKDGAYIHVFGGHDTGTIYIQTVSIKIEY